MKTKTETFKVTSGHVVIGDPCYSTNQTVPALNGSWEAHVETCDAGSWGTRIRRVTVHHKDFDPAADMKTVRRQFGVDSGQAGVFCESVYESDGIFYDSCCEETLTAKSCGFVRGGFVSSSGYGDGCYEAIIHVVRGKAACVELEFIEEE